MDTKRYMVVKFEVKEEHIEYVKKALLSIVGPTLKEDGCLQYDLHQDIDNPCIFMFYEIWETTEAWRKHDTMPHIETFRKVIDGYAEKITFNTLERL